MSDQIESGFDDPLVGHALIEWKCGKCRDIVQTVRRPHETVGSGLRRCAALHVSMGCSNKPITKDDPHAGTREELRDRVRELKTKLSAAHTEAQKRHEEYARALNKRVDVESVLLAVAAGKREPLTREECRALAGKLGQPVAATATCKWKQDGNEWEAGPWEGECGATWEFTNDGPVENEMRHCPRCGRRVELKEGVER